jgi:hypothetical protein
MITREDVNKVLAHVGQRHHLDGLALDPNDCASLVFGDEGLLVLDFNVHSGIVTLWSPVSALTIAQTAAEERTLLRYVLHLGFPAARLNGGHVALGDNSLLMFSRPLRVDPRSPEEAVTQLQQFAEEAQRLGTTLRNGDWRHGEGEKLNLPPSPQASAATGFRV